MSDACNKHGTDKSEFRRCGWCAYLELRLEMTRLVAAADEMRKALEEYKNGGQVMLIQLTRNLNKAIAEYDSLRGKEAQ